jgi:hypothetical protein
MAKSGSSQIPASMQLSAFRVRGVGPELPVELLSVAPAVLEKKLALAAGPQFLPDRLPKVTVHEPDGLFVMNGHTVFVFNHHGIPLSHPADDMFDLSPMDCIDDRRQEPPKRRHVPHIYRKSRKGFKSNMA